MSKDDEEEEEEEESECFYESLDRILSSSNSSTSNSEDDCDVVFNTSPPSYHDYHLSTNLHSSSVSCGSRSTPSVSKFSMSVPNYDVWISESFSSSVEQRRDRLLRALGLASDPTLSRRKPAISDHADGLRFDCNRSVSFDHLSCGDRKGRIEKRMCSSNVLRSKSDGSTECESAVQHGGSICDQSNSSFATSSSSIFSIRSVSNTVNSDSNKNNHNNVDSTVGVDNLVNDGALGSMSCWNKPPFGKSDRRVDEIQCHSRNLSGRLCSDRVTDGNGGDDCGEDAECNGIEKVSDKMCTIKNLDNGKEFVVNEVRDDDGMCDKLKEVETGRQLTMEEFQMRVGHSPIVQELMRRQNVEGRNKDASDFHTNGNGENGSKLKKKVSWLKSIKSVASSVTGHKERRSSDERDTSSEKGGRRSSSATDDSQDVSFQGPERVRVRHYGKSLKELSAFYKSHEIQGHNGSIWTIKFSLDGKYLASAGEDCVIHVWQVVETERKGELLIDRSDDMGLTLFLTDGSPEPTSLSPRAENPLERKRRGRTSISRKSISLDHIVVPDTIFGLSEKPFCSFQGHIDDVLDLSWSESQLLLSSSMDKTVRLWNLSIKTCLKVFSHSDYVTCIQFNPVDDRYFISGSLDCKVRIWSIPDCRVVDWNDLHEMVTAACYTPDGQGALVGSYKGSCRLYNTSESKLQQKCQINLQNKKNKSHLKKITGFQFAPGSSSEVFITSADSRVRVVDGVDLVHKFKGFRNTNSQISASLTANGKYVVCASEDSHVYVWKHEGESRPSRSKGVTVTRSYEYFHCQDVAVSIPWPGINDGSWGLPDACAGEQNGARHQLDEVLTANHPPTPVEEFNGGSPSARGFGNGTPRGTIASATNNYFFDRIAATWPEEKLLMATKNRSPRVSLDLSNGMMNNRSAWGLVIVTAGLRGEIRTFQNFGLPVRI